MNVKELREALDEVFDQALVYHAYADYMRDYEVIIHAAADPRTGISPEYLRYLFRYCVEAEVRTAVPPDVWRRSLDDRLIDYAAGVDLEGYVWGVKWQSLYPGAGLVPDSPRAAKWTEEIGIDFHEVQFRTNGHDLALVFADLQVTKLPQGYAPFTTPS